MHMTLQGRPKALGEQELAEVQKLYWEEGLPVREIADFMKVSHMTIWRAIVSANSAGDAWKPGSAAALAPRGE